MKKFKIEYEYIYNFDDDYYAIPIPKYVIGVDVTITSTHKDCIGREYFTYKVISTGESYSTYFDKLYDTENEALKAFTKKRKEFVERYPNNWEDIIRLLKELIK